MLALYTILYQYVGTRVLVYITYRSAHVAAGECAKEGGRRAVEILVLQAPSLAPPARSCASGRHAEQHTEHVLLRVAERHEFCVLSAACALRPATHTHAHTHTHTHNTHTHTYTPVHTVAARELFIWGGLTFI